MTYIPSSQLVWAAKAEASTRPDTNAHRTRRFRLRFSANRVFLINPLPTRLTPGITFKVNPLPTHVTLDVTLIYGTVASSPRAVTDRLPR